jgi:hypothetical protein
VSNDIREHTYPATHDSVFGHFTRTDERRYPTNGEWYYFEDAEGKVIGPWRCWEDCTPHDEPYAPGRLWWSYPPDHYCIYKREEPR